MAHKTLAHRIFEPMRKFLPHQLTSPIRAIATAVLTPAYFAAKSGHLRSSLARAPLTPDGRPLPWYTYPAIDFLRARDFTGRRVLEFGGGHSTRFWAERAASVVTCEGDPAWHARLTTDVPPNVRLHLVAMGSPEACVADVERAVRDEAPFDIVVIDGLWREHLADIARRVRLPDGVIIVDNAEGYDTFENFRDGELMRVDFHGHAPGVLLPECTSIFFGARCFLFVPTTPIVSIATR